MKVSQAVDLFSTYRNDLRYKFCTEPGYADLLQLHLLMICGGYEGCNDIQHLRNDPAVGSVVDFMPGQGALGRFGHSMI